MFKQTLDKKSCCPAHSLHNDVKVLIINAKHVKLLSISGTAKIVCLIIYGELQIAVSSWVHLQKSLKQVGLPVVMVVEYAPVLLSVMLPVKCTSEKHTYAIFFVEGMPRSDG